MDEPNLTLQMQSANYINSACKWMKFVGITAIVMVAFMFLAGVALIIMGGVFAGMPIPSSVVPGMGIITGITYIISAIICIFPTIFMLRAAKAGKAAVALHDNSKMAEFARNTKSYWKFNGIVLIVVLAFLALCLIGGIAAGVAMVSAL